MALPKFEDWKAPWETAGEDGETPEFDPAKAKRHQFNLLSDKEKLQGQVTTLTAERDEFKQKVEEAAREGETETERLKRELAEANEKANKATEKSIETMRLEVALDKGLTKVQAKRLIGSTVEELEADADELLASFGGSGRSADDGDDDGEDEGEQPRVRPQRRASNAGDPKDGSPDKAWDVDKAADAYVAGNAF